MMACEALVFDDLDVFAQVIGAGADDICMRAVKDLGRQVKNFDETVWKRVRERIVLEGNLHRFKQNGELRVSLLATGHKIIVEASPRDRIWGIGFGEERVLDVRGRWGLSLLGKALMDVRETLREER